MNAHTNPAQLAAESIPVADPGDAPLTLWLADLNDMNDCLGSIAASIRYDHRDFMDRVVMAHVGSSAFKVMCAINTRTFSFTKVAETIPQGQFENGLRRSNKNNTLATDKYGKSLFEGTGLSRNSIKTGVEELKAKGLLTTFAVMIPKTGPVLAYMPISWRNLFICASPYLGCSMAYLAKLCREHPGLKERLFSPAGHELEARYADQFPDGLKMASAVRTYCRDDLSRVRDWEILEAVRRNDERIAMEGVRN